MEYETRTFKGETSVTFTVPAADWEQIERSPEWAALSERIDRPDKKIPLFTINSFGRTAELRMNGEQVKHVTSLVFKANAGAGTELQVKCGEKTVPAEEAQERRQGIEINFADGLEDLITTLQSVLLQRSDQTE